MRGYFGIGVQGISKAANLGAVMRTAHAFGASFVYTIDAYHKALRVDATDRSRTLKHLPHYQWDNVDDMRLPQGCTLVGVELCERSVEMPSFRHPLAAAYVLGPEQGSLSPEIQDLCTYIVKIPTKFCINVSLAAALTLYDRTLCLGGYPERPLEPGGPDLAALEEWRALRARNG
ncbi:MAG: rRNA methyltransferase [Robiginitomaculum sp.]|nr:MAG: rRNA methyltransferase [Robiginitomaculum sp.]